MKRWISRILVVCMLCTLVPCHAMAVEQGGFVYGVHDEALGTIKITGYTGTLTRGQDLAIPSEIDGKTVVAIEGTYGTVGAGLGTFTLPNTIQSIKNLHVYGFTGTLTIPSSVTTIAQPDGLYFSDIEELVINATMEMYFQNAYYTYNNHESPLKKIVIGDGIKYFIASHYFGSEFSPNLETVEVSDSVQYIGANGSKATFYLKKFDSPKVKRLNNNTPPTYVTTNEMIAERGVALGLTNCKYYYTNKNVELPTEQMYIAKKTGFTRFTENDGYNYYSYDGLYSGEIGTVELATSPINATDIANAAWTSSDPSVATVDDGEVLAVCAGKTTISVSLNGLTESFEVMVKGVSTDGFSYATIDNTDNIKITGYSGALTSGQNLVIPSEINGKTVVAIEGTYGTVGAGLGTFTLPNTIQSIKNLHVYGFTGTLTIPSSVTTIAQPDGLYFSDIEELVINATMEMYFQNAYYTYNNHESPLKKIVIGDGIKYFIASHYFGSEFSPNLETVEVSDSVQYIGANGSKATFYLKKFDSPKVKRLNNNTPPTYVTTNEMIAERGVALGLTNCKYYYTNKNVELPTEQMYIAKKSGFTRFSETNGSNGLYAGWDGSVELEVSPINTTDTSTVQWASSDESVATVKNGVVHAVDIGTTTITATRSGKMVSIPVMVRGILIVSSSNGVNADNLEGNMDINSGEIDTTKGVSLELEVDKLNPKDWTQWGQLKKALEEALEKSLECSDAFDIQVKLKNGTTTWKVQPIEGKRISIWMPIEDAQDISKRHLIHVNDDGKFSELEFDYEPIDGVHGIRFETESFSDFILVTEAAEEPADPKDPTDPEGPTDPEDPTNPEDPADPEDPTNPEKPVRPPVYVPSSPPTGTVTKPDGSTVTTDRDSTGTKSETVVDKNGIRTTEVTVTNKAVRDAVAAGESVILPMPAATATKDSATAPSVTVDLPAGIKTAKVEIPVENVTTGTVAVIIHADGTEEVVRTSVPTEDGIELSIESGATVKIMDMSRDFSDVPDTHAFNDAIDFASARGIIEGYGDSFGVGNYATSAATTTVIARIMGEDFYGSGATVKAQDWAKENGIAAGLDLSGNVTRGDFMVMLWRAAGCPIASVTDLDFADTSKLNDVERAAIAWAVENDIIGGYSDSTVRPDANITRGAMAAIAQRYMTR